MKQLLTLAWLGISALAMAQTPAQKPAQKPQTSATKPTAVQGSAAKPAQTATKPAPAKTTVPPAKQLNLKVHVKGASEGSAVLANYFGDKQYIQDSAKVDANGNMVFKSTEKHDAGIYILQFPTAAGPKYFEVILLDGQMNFSLETDTADLVGKMKVTGSKENEVFQEHNLYLSKKSKEMEKLQVELKKATEAKDSTEEKKVREKITALDSEVKSYKREFYQKKYPDSFFSKVLRAMDEPDLLPYDKCPRLPNGNIDSAYNNRNYKQHYWDGFDFSDGRMLRTPVYHNKLKFYLEKITSPEPDSIIKAAHWIIAQTNDSDLFKYAVHYVTYNYEVSKVMGYDAIFVNMVQTYHMKNKVWWLNDTQKKKIIERAEKLKFTLIGATAVDIELPDSNGVLRRLHYVNADYTIVVFWEPTCGHCKHDLPVIKTYYDSLRAAGVSVEVYAINAEYDSLSWEKFIRDNKLTWINVMSADPQLVGKYKYFYDVYSTPTLYILDKQKKIFAKRLDAKGVEAFLNRRINDDRKKARQNTPK
ncbi:MAG: DUF5106 domain-containing protein [Bacteroidia bacterium]|jgi:thiol-disulfide isomerase/thioredoxin|nr:DUF5106 domain-containing protein [Bacteroidia bacterium]